MFHLLSTSGLSGVEKVSRVHSTGESLDQLSSTKKMNVHSTELEGRIPKLDCCSVKSWMSKAKTWMLHKSKLNVECKKVESRVQTQMTNTIDCAKYNVKWNIEFWRKWNAILGTKLKNVSIRVLLRRRWQKHSEDGRHLKGAFYMSLTTWSIFPVF